MSFPWRPDVFLVPEGDCSAGAATPEDAQSDEGSVPTSGCCCSTRGLAGAERRARMRLGGTAGTVPIL